MSFITRGFSGRRGDRDPRLPSGQTLVSDWPAPAGQVTKSLLEAVTVPAASAPRIFACGPTPFVETVADWLLELGHRPEDVRTERFGGS